jgi:hypothetical protein
MSSKCLVGIVCTLCYYLNYSPLWAVFCFPTWNSWFHAVNLPHLQLILLLNHRLKYGTSEEKDRVGTSCGGVRCHVCLDHARVRHRPSWTILSSCSLAIFAWWVREAPTSSALTNPHFGSMTWREILGWESTRGRVCTGKTSEFQAQDQIIDIMVLCARME